MREIAWSSSIHFTATIRVTATLHEMAAVSRPELRPRFGGAFFCGQKKRGHFGRDHFDRWINKTLSVMAVIWARDETKHLILPRVAAGADSRCGNEERHGTIDERQEANTTSPPCFAR
jgi:hypothetical protein